MNTLGSVVKIKGKVGLKAAKFTLVYPTSNTIVIRSTTDPAFSLLYNISTSEISSSCALATSQEHPPCTFVVAKRSPREIVFINTTHLDCSVTLKLRP